MKENLETIILQWQNGLDSDEAMRQIEKLFYENNT